MNILQLEWKLFIGKLLGRKRNTSYVVIQKGGKFLLIQEKMGHIRGLWGLPGGGIKEGESEEDAAVREAKEEAGCDVEIEKKVGSYDDKKRASIRNIFKAKLIHISGDYDEEEVLQVKWFSKEEIFNMKDQLRGEWVLEAIKNI